MRTRDRVRRADYIHPTVFDMDVFPVYTGLFLFLNFLQRSSALVSDLALWGMTLSLF